MWGGGCEVAFMVLPQQHVFADDSTQWGRPRGSMVDEEGPVQGAGVRKASLDIRPVVRHPCTPLHAA